jgi:hypothetical protein
MEDVRERRKELRQFDAELKKLMGSVNSPTRLALDLMLLTPPHTIVSQRVAKIMVGLLMPALGAAAVSAERIRLNERMVETAFALMEYRAEHTDYPETLGGAGTAIHCYRAG